MRPVLFDTNAYASFKLGDDSTIEVMQYAETIGITPIVIGELLAGFDHGKKSKQNRLEFQQFLESPRVKIFSITADTAQFFSQVYYSLRMKGKPIPTNDMWIAAQAMEHGCVVCTLDKHFAYVEGLVSGSTSTDLFI
jgi:predicted nucleic acid-binding protein